MNLTKHNTENKTEHKTGQNITLVQTKMSDLPLTTNILLKYHFLDNYLTIFVFPTRYQTHSLIYKCIDSACYHNWLRCDESSNLILKWYLLLMTVDDSI